MEQKPNYKSWSHEKLIERVTQLEQELKNKNLRLISPFNILEGICSCGTACQEPRKRRKLG
jgi:hypothetical protein